MSFLGTIKMGAFNLRFIAEKSFFYYFVRTKDVFYPYLLSFIYFGLGET